MSHRADIARAAVKEGHEVHVATTLTREASWLEELGVTVHPMNIDRSGASPLGLLKLFFSYRRVIRNVDPDVVHFVTIKPVLVGGAAARFCKVRGVLYAVSGLGHVFTDSTMLTRLLRTLVKKWYRFVLSAPRMKIIFQNDDDRKAVESICPLSKEQIVMIPGSGVDLRRYSWIAPNESNFTVLMASRLLRAKGVIEYIEAARIISRKYHNIRFLLVGAPDFDNPTSISARELDDWRSEGVVDVLGHRNDIADLMNDSHIVVLPSYYGEGLPKVLIEAAACGRAVVTTDMPGCRDAIEDGVTGILVPPRDAISLANAILALYENREKCVEMGAEGRIRAERIFDVKAVVKAHIDIYNDLCVSV